MQKKPIEPETENADSWAEDQQKRDYYYDDAHGYEEYDPEREEDAEDLTPVSDSEDQTDGQPPSVS
jgi:hypothetical protein